jgi:oligopeptide transport system permease protein
MLNYLIKRIVGSVITLWVVVTITFLLMHAIPGGPFDREKPLPPEVKTQIEARYHLDRPLWWQYSDYMKHLAHFDLGPSFQYQGRTVNNLISDGFPATAQLGILSVLIALLFGIPFGIAAALKQGKWVDNFVMFLSIIGITIPNFVLAIMLLFVFALKLNLFPTMGWDSWKNVILPAIALSAQPTAMISRLTRSSLLDVVRQDYIRTARAKGVPEFMVVVKHALRNALIPVVTYLGPAVSAVLTGSFVIETIFSVPGIGRQFVLSINNRDYTVILGLTIFDATLLITFNFIVDLLYAAIDPRIKYSN